MNITDHLRQAADSSDTRSLDLDHLARVARVQGTRARRRRRGTAVLGSAALVGIVALGSGALSGRGPDRAWSPSASGTPTPSPSVAPTTASLPPTPVPSVAPTGEPSAGASDLGPATGRGVTAALSRAVADVAQGRAGAFAGQAGGGEAYGQLDWSDADGLGVSVIGVNVQPGSSFVSSCGQAEVHCTSTVHHGATLTTFEEHLTVRGGVGTRRTADLLRADGTRVVVSETNGYDLPSNRWDVTRAQPPLSSADLTRIVREPWWGAELPTYLLDEGDRLTPYEDLDDTSSTPTASSHPSSSG